ncbi:MAG: PadR family transcriptional regulator [Chloroflexi bacterium]|nr:PadR family transcriptional regulator [Chloroflexota bacterium]
MSAGHNMFHDSWRREHQPRGALKYVILDLIRDQPRHGYEIIQICEERSHGFYAPSPGVVYPTLQLLEEMGYVTSTQQDAKRVYSITEEGRRFLADRDDLAQGIKKRMRDLWDLRGSRELRDAAAEFRRIGHLFARRRRHLDQEKISRITGIISHASAEIEAILEEE